VVTAPQPTWRVSVDKDTCIGSGICAGLAPDVFTLVDGVSVALEPAITPGPATIDAAESCPVEAIAVRDAADGHLVAPEG
jgi:ferredoxin